MVFEIIRKLLIDNGIEHREVHHAPTFTSNESAAARGEDLSAGGKALLLKVGEEFRLFVLSAALKLDSAAVKEYFQVKKTRFATAEELRTLTGLAPGSVPPFGKPVLPFDLYLDPSITANEKIAFNAGSLTDSIVMRTGDYIKIANPRIFRFAL
ncbi:MAG: hypothetical protein M3Y07_14445 [Acidobacteriota bacterium]|nr:hypothetical protein [Acidobacteriota bacterium]